MAHSTVVDGRGSITCKMSCSSTANWLPNFPTDKVLVKDNNTPVFRSDSYFNEVFSDATSMEFSERWSDETLTREFLQQNQDSFSLAPAPDYAEIEQYMEESSLWTTRKDWHWESFTSPEHQEFSHVQKSALERIQQFYSHLQGKK